MRASFLVVASLALTACAPSLSELAARHAWPEVVDRSARDWYDPERACALSSLVEALDASVTLEPLWTSEGCGEACATGLDVPEVLFLVRIRHAALATPLRFDARIVQGERLDRGYQTSGLARTRIELGAELHLHHDPSIASRRPGDDARPPDSLGRSLVDVLTLGATASRPEVHDDALWDETFDRVCTVIGCEAAFERVAACDPSETCALMAVHPRVPELEAHLGVGVSFSLPEGHALEMFESVELDGSSFVQAVRAMGTLHLTNLRALGGEACSR